MVRIEHLWTCAVPHVRHGQGHVVLGERLVVGQMHAIDRRHGRLLWSHAPGRPGNVRGLAADIVIADRDRAGARRGGCGACALDGATGRMLWNWNNANPLLGFLGRFIDDVCQSIAAVDGGKVRMSDGTVLDARSGLAIRAAAEAEAVAPSPPAVEAEFRATGRYRFADGSWVAAGDPEAADIPGLRRVTLLGGGPDGESWEWQMPRAYGCLAGEHGLRLTPEGLVLMMGATSRPGEARLFALDIRDGQVASEWLLAPAVSAPGRPEWRIEDARAAEVVISHADGGGGAGTVHLFRLDAAESAPGVIA
ncbi:outer membrane protein assembly factor BamB family protein [Paracraurococcus ruber]|uniref:Pyrrolo-quinoline quinone repeat domain-containing protein n=2 Tax=Paracraurococcus ruber TaxID=77675 RepID=A0ABS1D105_9PROT|nr:hypothetical protein [Paracraurococcus ruber]